MKESKISLGAGIGLLAGIIIGSATDNVGLWIALGLCFGAGIGTTLEKKKKKKLILLLKFLRTGLTIRNLFISILGATVFLFIIFAIQFFIGGSLDSIRWDNDLIFPIILGAAVSLGFFEKPTITWEEYWKKNS